MCFAFQPPERDFVFVNDNVESITSLQGDIVEMYWDLIPKWYQPQAALSEVKKLKKSQAINPKTNTKIGYSSYNARIESIVQKPTFKSAWLNGRRFVTPAKAFRERANMDEAPPEYKNREYNVYLDSTKYLAGIYEIWSNGKEELISCSIITTSSIGNKVIQGIYHERCPIILEGFEVEEWLDPNITPEMALKMCKLISSDKISAEKHLK